MVERTDSLRERSQRITVLLLLRGEFRVFNGVILLSLYGAAVLSIPLILNSFFQLSDLFLAQQSQTNFAVLLLAIYNRTIDSYGLVIGALLLGFIVASFVLGISIGRRMTNLEINYSHFGISNYSRRKSKAISFLLVALASTALSFSFAFILTSVATYCVSLLLHAPYLTPTLNVMFWIYLLIIFLVSFVALIAGGFRGYGLK